MQGQTAMYGNSGAAKSYQEARGRQAKKDNPGGKEQMWQ